MSKTIYSTPTLPSTLPSSLINKPIPRAKTGTFPTLAKAEYAKDYSLFLASYFYNPATNLQLDIPHHYIKTGIESKRLIGVEVRDTSGKLVGCVFDFYSGKTDTTKSTGIVSWMCVLPSWRNKGIGSCLLFALYFYTLPREVHFWRNDGWMRSPIPPLYNESRIQRKKQAKRTSIHRSTLQLKRVPFIKWQPHFIKQWTMKYPHGIILNDETVLDREVWEVYSIAAILVQPTFEKRLDTKETYCEIIAWATISKAEYEQAQLIETMIDHLPYDYIEAPDEMPHFDQDWQKTSKVCWSCIGLDPGSPVMRPILSLCGVF